MSDLGGNALNGAGSHGEGTQNAVIPQIIYATALVDGWEPDGEKTAEPESAGYFPDGSFVVSPSTAAHEIEWLKSKARDASGLPVAGWKMAPEGNGADCLYHFFPESARQEADPYKLILTSALLPQGELIPEPPTVLSIGGRVFGSAGNFSIISGKAKTGKSFLSVMAVAAAVTNGTRGAFTGSLPADKRKVLAFDTEQSRYHAQRMQSRVLRLAGVECSDSLKCYSLRTLPASDRLAVIDYALRNTPGVGLVIIDGIRDLATDPILDAKDAEKVLSALMKWSEIYGCHIVAVLHQNKGDGNVRGHLGTEVVNKAETVVSVGKMEHDKGISVVEPMHARDREFEPFGFSITDAGLPVLAEGWEMRRTNYDTQKGFTPLDIADETLTKICADVFAIETEMPYAELVSNFKVAMQRHGKKIGDNKAKDFITHCKNKGLICESGKAGTRAKAYHLPKPDKDAKPSKTKRLKPQKSEQMKMAS